MRIYIYMYIQICMHMCTDMNNIYMYINHIYSYSFICCRDWIGGLQGHRKTKGQCTKADFMPYVFRYD